MPQKQVYAEENPGKVVFYQISTASTDESVYFNRGFIVLKNIGGESVDISNYSIYSQSNKNTSAFQDSNVKFPEGTILQPNEYFLIVQCANDDTPENPHKSTSIFTSNLPEFIKNMEISNLYRMSGSVLGGKKAYLLYKQPDLT